MSLPIPVLDNKTFDVLVAEARTLIPRFSKEWTDHNIHDPGITFIELFAWLAETYIYQLDQLEEKNFEKFLHLINLKRRTAQPAKTWVQIKNPPTLLWAGSQLVVNIGSTPIMFESEHDLHGTIAEIISIVPDFPPRTEFIDANEKEGVSFPLFSPDASTGSKFKIGFDQPPGMTEITFILFEKDLRDRPNQDDCEPHIDSSVELQWECLVGDEWKELKVTDYTVSLNRSGIVRIHPPHNLTRKDDAYWISCKIRSGYYDIAPYIETVQLNTVEVLQVNTQSVVLLNDEGTGEPWQKIKLPRAPMLGLMPISATNFSKEEILDLAKVESFLKEIGSSGSATPTQLNVLLRSRTLYEDLQVDPKKLNPDALPLVSRRDSLSEGDLIRLNRIILESRLGNAISSIQDFVQTLINNNWVNWTPVENFESTAPSDRHYILQKDQILFGNGLNGYIPQRNEKIRLRFLKDTLGEQGNVPATQIFSGAGITGKNLLPASGGIKAADIKELKAEASKYLNKIDRAVTSSDYEELALGTPGIRVARVKALTDYHPDFPCNRVPGTITIVAIPDSREQDLRLPSSQFLAAIRSHLNSHRLVTTNVFVVAAIYFKVDVAADVRLKPYQGSKDAKDNIQTALKKLFNPIKRGKDETDWPFGRSIYRSEICQAIQSVENVECVLRVAINEEDTDEKTIPATAVVYPGEIQIRFV